MKKIIVIIAISMSLNNIAAAQERKENEIDNRQKFSIGVKIGLSSSNVYDTRGDQYNADSKLGLTGGAFLGFPINKFLGFQPEALISQKGFRANGSLLGNNYDLKRTTTFFELPLLLAFKPNEFIKILVGPQYAYMLKQKDVFTSSLYSYAQEQEIKNDNIRKNIFGFVGGLDICLKHLTLSGRVGIDAQNNNGDGTSNTPRYKNVWLHATVGYKLY